MHLKSFTQKTVMPIEKLFLGALFTKVKCTFLKSVIKDGILYTRITRFDLFRETNVIHWMLILLFCNDSALSQAVFMTYGYNSSVFHFMTVMSSVMNGGWLAKSFWGYIFWADRNKSFSLTPSTPPPHN